MKAIVVSRYGGPEVLEPVDAPDPEPGPGQLLVEVAAAGVNFIDVYHRIGRYPMPLPLVPGQEAAGRVLALGEGVATDGPDGWAVGDRVAWAGQLGGYAERAVVAADRALRVPDGVGDREAAAFPLQGMTAHYLVRSTYPVRAGDDVLVHAAAGGVGLLLVQLVRHLGGRVVATVSTPEKAELARAAGAHDVILYRDEDVPARVRELTGGRGVHVVYDGVGRDTFEGSLASLRVRGTMVLFGASSGAPDPLDLDRLNPLGSLYVTRPTLGHYTADRDELRRRAGEVLGWLGDGTLRLRIGATYPLADAAQAHRDLQARLTTGKVLLLP